MTLLAESAQVGSAVLVSNLLALDQSSHTTGYAIFKDNKLIKASHFDASGSDLGDRLVDIKRKVINLIQEYEIDEVVFEDIQLQNVNGSREAGIKTFKILAEVYGVLSELFSEIKMPYDVAMPIKWKAHFHIAGKGRTQEKKMSQAQVLSTYGLKCTEDEADAVCIGGYYLSLNDGFDWS